MSRYMIICFYPNARYLHLKVVRNRAVIDLKDKVVMIAGANGGIGSHVAEVLIECGTTTALGLHFNSAQDDEVRVKAASAGKDCRLSQIDITKLDSVPHL